MKTTNTIKDCRLAMAEELLDEVCQDPGCGNPTSGGKPVCVDHIEHMLYAREVMARVANGIAATKRRRITKRTATTKTIRRAA